MEPATRTSNAARRHGGRPPVTPPKSGRLFAALLLVFVGIVIGRMGAAGSAPPERSPAVGDTRRPTAATPVAAARTPTGAVRAATRFLNSLRWWVLVDAQRRHRAIDRLVASEARPRLEAQLARGVTGVRSVVATKPVVAWPAALGYRVESFAGDQASVSIWGLVVFGSASYEPVSQWATSTLNLAWQDGSWKVTAMHNRPGPSPRWSIEELTAAVAAFKEYRHVP